MGLKKRNKAMAEFSMSSLTDIIFLLLVFFMLTATFVNIKPVDLPESDTKAVAPSSLHVVVEKSGSLYVNGEAVEADGISQAIRKAASGLDNQENTTITIVAEKGVPFNQVMKILTVASDLKFKAILATQPKR